MFLKRRQTKSELVKLFASENRYHHPLLTLSHSSGPLQITLTSPPPVLYVDRQLGSCSDVVVAHLPIASPARARTQPARWAACRRPGGGMVTSRCRVTGCAVQSRVTPPATLREEVRRCLCGWCCQISRSCQASLVRPCVYVHMLTMCSVSLDVVSMYARLYLFLYSTQFYLCLCLF